MSIAKSIQESLGGASWIRKMFEEGARLKALHGADNVFDFSIGNPDTEPPQKFFQVIKELVNSGGAGVHGYMANSGYPAVRDAIAGKISREHQVSLAGDSVVMTCGASGALNIILKTFLDPGDEVIVSRPYFVEYGSYVANHGGKMVLVDTLPDFTLDIRSIEKAITSRTKMILINSPNNPTGRIYPESVIRDLGSLADSRNIYVVSDEPYREIAYNGIIVPPVMKYCARSIIATSYSKSLSIPGERIGYAAVNPACPGHADVMAGLNLSNRILGFVNAPALMQRVVARLTEEKCDVESYLRRRDILGKGLSEAGYDYVNPEGAFYIFCRAPGGNDIAYVQHLQKYNVLVVPGTGFGGPGYFRIAYCVPQDTITRSLPVFRKAREDFGGK